MNYRKPGAPLLRPAGGKIAKPKHNNKIHLFGYISRKGLTPLVMFKGTMYSKDYQNFLSLTVVPLFDKNFTMAIVFSMTMTLNIQAGHQDAF